MGLGRQDRVAAAAHAPAVRRLHERHSVLSLVLRRAVPDDRNFLYELFAQTMRSVVEQTWGWDEEWQRMDFDRRFDSYEVSVVEFDARPIGGLFLEHGPDATCVHELQLVSDYQGRGIGTALVRRVIDEAAARGVPVTLSVVPANQRAQRLYERLGFAVVAIESPFIRMRRDPRIERAV